MSNFEAVSRGLAVRKARNRVEQLAALAHGVLEQKVRVLA